MAPPVPCTNRSVIRTRYRELHSYKDAGLKIRNTRFKFFFASEDVSELAKRHNEKVAEILCR